ncbi:hypothetical protein ACVBEH_12435 [Roseateles sp. GG27B]
MWTASGCSDIAPHTARHVRTELDPEHQAARPQHLDPLAALRQARRLAQAAAEPWLHADVAQRMAERLSIIKLQPRRVLRWSVSGRWRAALAAAYPAAEQVCVELSPPLLERSSAEQKRGWWDALRRKSAVQVLAPQDVERAVRVGVGQYVPAQQR